jgi:hypothetical protein
MYYYTLRPSQPTTISLGEPMLAIGVEVTLSTSIFAASLVERSFSGGDLPRCIHQTTCEGWRISRLSGSSPVGCSLSDGQIGRVSPRCVDSL